MIPYKTVLVASLLGVLPAGAWLAFMIGYCRKRKWNKNFIIKAFFVGVLTAIPASFLEIFVSETGSDSWLVESLRQVWLYRGSELVLSSLVSVILIASIEEISKGLGIAFLGLKKRIKSLNDGMFLGFFAGLAFAVTENGVYIASALKEQTLENMFQIIFLRFLLSTTAHLIYSGLFGYLWAKFLLSRERQDKIVSVLQALLIPFSIHTLFNFLLGTALSWLVIVIIFIGVIALFRIYGKNNRLKNV